MMRRSLGLFLIIAGCAAALYGFFDWYDAKRSVEKLSDSEIEELEQIEEATYAQQQPSTASASAQTPLEPIPTTSVRHIPGEETASLIIPELGQKYSIYWGADDATLKQGVGMFVSDLTTVPGGNGHTVLSGHRDTVFTGLGELEKQDRLLIEYEGKVYIYEITDTWITHENDRSVIVKKDESILTLTTCYPFDYVGYATERYIVEAKLVLASSE